LAIASACVGPGSHAGLGAGVATGSALVPTSVSGGTTTTLSYHEEGGLVSRTLLAIIAVLGSAPRTRTTVDSSSSVSCAGSSCTVTTTETRTTEVLDTPAEMRAKAARLERTMGALRSSAIPMAFRLDIASRDLGGDASGWLSTFMYKGEPQLISDSMVLRISGGLGAGSLSFKERERTQLRIGTDMLVEDSVVEDASYSYFGIPIRVDLAAGSRGLVLYGQADFNILTLTDALFEDSDAPVTPSPFRFGIEERLGPASFGVGAIVTRMRTDGLTGLAELSLVL
jgi:YD repeat-containing protein